MGHRYWRVYITACDSLYYLSVAEIELRESVGGSDQTGAGTASASSAYYGAAALAVDNNTSTAWETTATVPAWWKYDFGIGVEKSLTELSITPSATFDRSPSEFSVEWSDDDTNWELADSFTHSWADTTAQEFSWIPTVSPDTADLILAGSTPVVAAAPSTESITITAGTPVATVGMAVYPSYGELAFTTGTPTTPITVMPSTGLLLITALTPLVEHFMEISGTTPNMRGSFTFADTVDFSGNTAQMQGDWAFVYPHDFAGETPASTGVFEFGMEIEGNTPGMSGAFVLEEIQYADFVGNTPVIQGSFEFGAEFFGKTPIMQGAFELEEETYGAFDVKSPAMFGGFEFSQEMDFSGTTPAMESAWTGEMEQYGSFAGLSPAMTGSFDFTTNELNFSGLSPAMQTAFALSVETTMVFSGNTPPTIGNVFIGVDASTDFTATSDEIIRFRRGYDNG